MKHLTQILIENGWKPHRKKWNGKEWVYIHAKFDNHYSSVENGMIDFRFLKDGKEVIWGLRERHKPPTLSYPINFIPDLTTWPNDDEINKYLSSKPHEEVYQEIVNYFSKMTTQD
jgi:hypothetical protein